MNTTVPLTLPEQFIEGSAQNFVTVVGELKDVHEKSKQCSDVHLSIL